MNDTRRNFEPLPLEETLPEERRRLDSLKEHADAETKKRIENVLNQTYRFDLASFEADVVKSERKAFEDKIEQEVVENLKDDEEYNEPIRPPGVEKFWEKELVDLNPLDFFKNTKEIPLDGERKLRFEDKGVGLFVVLETPTLSIKPEELLYTTTVNVDDLSTKELRMGIREFLYLLEDPKGVALVQKAREEGYELPNDLVYDLKNQFLAEDKEKNAKIKPASKKKAA